VFGIGATEYRSVAALQRLHDYSEWEPAVRAELEYAFKKKAMTLRTGAEFKAARARFPGQHEVLNLVTPCVIKHDADGKVLRRKFRVTAADVGKHPDSAFVTETYSGAVDGSSIRFIANATLGRPRKGKRRGLDVKGAYFEGKKLTPEEGGRSLWAPHTCWVGQVRLPCGWQGRNTQLVRDHRQRPWVARRRPRVGRRLRRLPARRGVRAVHRRS
jgi:hypothetical protein